jgi:hypothetical protein
MRRKTRRRTEVAKKAGGMKRVARKRRRSMMR